MNDNTRLRTEVVVVTPEKANEWLTLCRFNGQRPPRPKIVTFYSEEMKRGDFHFGTTVEFGTVNGSDFLLDGQHRLSAVVESGVAQTFLVKRMQYHSDNELADAYSRIDQGLRRTTSDQFRAWQLADLYGLTPTWLNKFSAGVKVINSKFDSGGVRERMHPSDLVSLMDDYADAMVHYYQLQGGGTKVIEKPMQRSSTVAVALVTLRYSLKSYGESKVDDFWFGVIQDDGLKWRDPRKVAREHLLTTKSTGGSFGAQATSAYTSRYLARCFNAHVNGQEIDFARPNISQPVVILGSPFNGK